MRKRRRDGDSSDADGDDDEQLVGASFARLLQLPREHPLSAKRWTHWTRAALPLEPCMCPRSLPTHAHTLDAWSRLHSHAGAASGAFTTAFAEPGQAAQHQPNAASMFAASSREQLEQRIVDSEEHVDSGHAVSAVSALRRCACVLCLGCDVM
jgi:hypothetical protein